MLKSYIGQSICNLISLLVSILTTKVQQKKWKTSLIKGEYVFEPFTFLYKFHSSAEWLPSSRNSSCITMPVKRSLLFVLCNSIQQYRLLSDHQQTSSNENSLNQSECLRGGLWDMYTRSGVTCFNSCPNLQLETVSPLYWHWISPDLTRLQHSHLRHGQYFPCCFPNGNLTWPKPICSK